MGDDLGLEIGVKVKAIRAERGLSGRKLAAAADVSQPFLSQLEAGRTSVAIATLYRIAAALDVRPSDLLPGPPADVEVQVLRASERARIPVSEVPHAQTARTAYRAGKPITEVGDYLHRARSRRATNGSRRADETDDLRDRGVRCRWRFRGATPQ